MSIAECCSICQFSYTFNHKYFKNGEITCTKCRATCEYYFLADNNDSQRIDPPDISSEENLMPPQILNTTDKTDNTDLNYNENNKNNKFVEEMNNIKNDKECQTKQIDEKEKEEKEEKLNVYNSQNLQYKEVKECKDDEDKEIIEELSSRTSSFSNFEEQVKCNIVKDNIELFYKNHPIFLKGINKIDDLSKILDLEIPVIEKSKER